MARCIASKRVRCRRRQVGFQVDEIERGEGRTADRRKVAVICVTHLNKGQSAAIYRSTGSLEFIAAARAAWLVAKDPNEPDRRLFLPVKNNLADDTLGMAFSIVDGVLQWEPDPIEEDVNRILTTIPGQQSQAADGTADLLRQFLADGPTDATDVEQWATENGITTKRLRKAKQLLGAVSRKTGFDGRWQWSVPAQEFQVSLPTRRGILELFDESSSTGSELASLASVPAVSA